MRKKKKQLNKFIQISHIIITCSFKSFFQQIRGSLLCARRILGAWTRDKAPCPWRVHVPAQGHREWTVDITHKSVMYCGLKVRKCCSKSRAGKGGSEARCRGRQSGEACREAQTCTRWGVGFPDLCGEGDPDRTATVKAPCRSCPVSRSSKEAPATAANRGTLISAQSALRAPHFSLKFSQRPRRSYGPYPC